MELAVRQVNEETIGGEREHVLKLLCLLVRTLNKGSTVLGRWERSKHGCTSMNDDGAGCVGSLEEEFPCVRGGAANKKDRGSGAGAGFGVVGSVEVTVAKSIVFDEGIEISGDEFTKVGCRKMGLKMEK